MGLFRPPAIEKGWLLSGQLRKYAVGREWPTSTALGCSTATTATTA